MIGGGGGGGKVPGSTDKVSLTDPGGGVAPGTWIGGSQAVMVARGRRKDAVMTRRRRVDMVVTPLPRDCEVHANFFGGAKHS